jgi:predicted alpha/beta-fold hydrolase
MVEIKNFHVEMPDGFKLAAYEFSTPKLHLNSPIMVVFHGLGGNGQDESLLPVIHQLVGNGFRVFSYDYRYAGNSQSPGTRRDPANVKNVIGFINPAYFQKIFSDPVHIITWIRTLYPDGSCKIGVVGPSLGGAIVLSSLLNDERLSIVVGLSAPHDYRDLFYDLKKGPFKSRLTYLYFKFRIKNFKKFLEVCHEVSPVSKIRPDGNYQNYVFLMHCKNDTVAVYSICFPKNKDKLKLPDKNVLVFDRGGHGFSGVQKEVIHQLVKWCKQKLC